MEITSLLYHFNSDLHDFIKLSDLNNKPLNRRNRKQKLEDIQDIAIQIYLYFGMKVEKNFIIKTLASDEEIFLKFTCCRHGKKTPKDLKNNKNAFSKRLDRRWYEIEDIFNKLEKIRLRLKIDPISIKEQAVDMLFHINGKKKRFNCAIGAIKIGQIYRIEGDSGKEILKCVEKGAGYREALMLSKIRHNNIMKLLGYDSKFELDFLIFNDCGTSLAKKMNDIRKLSLDVLQKLAHNFFDALAYLKSLHIVHGDIKPDNLTINDEHQLFIIDFDGAFIEGKGDSGLYTPYYCAPDYWNYQPRTSKYDVWAGAITFYEILHENLPWLNAEDLGAAICSLQLYFKTEDLEFNEILNNAIKNNIEERDNAEEIFTTLYLKLKV